MKEENKNKITDECVCGLYRVKYKSRAQNYGWSTDNVQPERWRDRPKTSLSCHSPVTPLSYLKKETKSSQL